MELKHYLVILRRWGWIVLLCIAQPTIVSYWFVSQQPRVYESRARYLVGPVMEDPDLTQGKMQPVSKIGRTYAELATTEPMVQRVIEKLHLSAGVDTVKKNVTATWSENTQILSIRASANDPETAANIANTIGETLMEQSPTGPESRLGAQRREAIKQIGPLEQSIQNTRAEIDQLTEQIQQTADEVTQRALIVQLDQRRARLGEAQQTLDRYLDTLQRSRTNQIAVMEPAVPEPEPIAPNVKTTVLAALLGGLVLGLVVMVLLEYFIDVIYTVEELGKATGLTCLGTIVRHKKLRGTGASQFVVQAHPETLAAESFRVLRANLQRVGGEPVVPTLLVTSAGQGNGKSEIAANLAISFARSGKRTILIDANLRQPRITTVFGLLDRPGLSSLLDTLDLLPEPVPIEWAPGLSVLPTGTPMPNSWELLGSQRMYQLIQECKARADVVIIDSPSLLYADALALAPQIDGVLLVASSGRTIRENATKAVESLRLVGAHLVGTVLNRTKPGLAYSYSPRLVQKRPGPTLVQPAVTLIEDKAAMAGSKLEVLMTEVAAAGHQNGADQASSNGSGRKWLSRGKGRG